MSGNIPFLSLSSALMCGVTVYRNQPAAANKLLAEAGYAVTACVAVIETVAAGILCVGAYLITPLNPSLFDHTAAHLASSSFCIVWSIANLFLNLFADSGTMMADEHHARRAVKNPFLLDRSALFHVKDSSRGFQGRS